MSKIVVVMMMMMMMMMRPKFALVANVLLRVSVKQKSSQFIPAMPEGG